jgi:hypothetical protein
VHAQQAAAETQQQCRQIGRSVPDGGRKARGAGQRDQATAAAQQGKDRRDPTFMLFYGRPSPHVLLLDSGKLTLKQGGRWVKSCSMPG